jgi:hypothetical protein
MKEATAVMDQCGVVFFKPTTLRGEKCNGKVT